jgi:hypothetical protein
MRWIDLEVLDGIETSVRRDANSNIVGQHRRLAELLSDATLAESEALRDEFHRVYREAEALVFPASTAYVKHCQALSDWTNNFDLITVDLARLRAVDLAAHEDETFRSYAAQMKGVLPKVDVAPKVKAYSQFYEVYSEALVLQFLRGKLRTARVPEGEEETPDFRCLLDDGREFFVEVKTLNIVDARTRHDQMMVDAIDQSLELKNQLAAGRSVAMAIGEFAPYKKHGESKTYDPRSLIRVIDTLRDKCFQAFKPGQFAMGPTFALAVTDRLIVPGRTCELAPYYIDHVPSPACVSGVLWHSAFGIPGTPIFRAPDFEGSSNLEGHLDKYGFLADAARPFEGCGLLALTRSEGKETAYSVHLSRHTPIGSWTADDTTEAVAVLCEAFNDESNSHAADVSVC